MDSNRKSLKVVMFPWLAHGHITPFLELANQLYHMNGLFQFYICSTPANLNSINEKKIPEKYIHLVQLHLPSLPELPPHYHTTNGLPLHLNSTLRKALRMAKQTFSDLLETLHPDLLILDINQPWAGESASHHRIPSVTFSVIGATMLSYFNHLGRNPAGVRFPFPEIRLTDFELSMTVNLLQSLTQDRELRGDYSRSTDGMTMLINTSREMEGKYMDYLSQLNKMEIIPVGVLIPHPGDGNDDADDEELMHWLERKDRFSTVFVSFGSEYFLKKEDVEEIAYGLELSNANFIWPLRFPKGEEKIEIDDVLPKGFLERVGERGRIVQKWAPQAKILRHSSTGGFVSHCGWNSLNEGIEYGVPIIAMPMHLEQPMNAKLAVHLGVAVEVMRNDEGMFQRGEIAKVIKHVLVGENGDNLRSKIEQQREKIRFRSRQEIKEVAEKLAQLCYSSIN